MSRAYSGRTTLSSAVTLETNLYFHFSNTPDVLNRLPGRQAYRSFDNAIKACVRVGVSDRCAHETFSSSLRYPFGTRVAALAPASDCPPPSRCMSCISGPLAIRLQAPRAPDYCRCRYYHTSIAHRRRERPRQGRPGNSHSMGRRSWYRDVMSDYHGQVQPGCK